MMLAALFFALVSGASISACMVLLTVPHFRHFLLHKLLHTLNNAVE